MKKKLQLFLIFILPGSIFAHPLDMGLFQSRVDGSKISVTLEMAPSIASLVSGIPESELTADTFPKKAQLFLLATFAMELISASSGTCDWQEATGTLNEGKIHLESSALCPAPPTNWRLKLPFLKRAPKNYELLVKADVGEKHHEFVLTAQNTAEVEFTETSNHSWADFILMGIQHIGATPGEWFSEGRFHLPDGIDHILFVLALILGGGGLISVLKTVTGFTLGHSITLALATLGIIQLPSRLVESAIALSIAFVAAEGLLIKNAKNRWKIATFFGLIHGMGFASALSELHLDQSSILKALVGFNLGVETGQAIIVAITFPILQWLTQKPLARRFVIPAFALSIFAAGSYWFIRRVFAI